MADYLIQAPDMETLNAYAATLGPSFWDGHAIIPQGSLPGGGEYFANFALDLAMPPGVWVRLRLNGENLFALGALPMPPAPIVVYPPTGTLGMPPDYVQPPYGQIA